MLIVTFTAKNVTLLILINQFFFVNLPQFSYCHDQVTPLNIARKKPNLLVLVKVVNEHEKRPLERF